MLRLNSNKLRFQGTVELPEPLIPGQDYDFLCKGACRGKSEDDNDDGTFDSTWKARLYTVDVVKADGQVIKSKDNKKKSQKLRGAIWNWAQEHGDDDENLYDWFMGWVIGNVDRLIPLAKAEREKEQ